MRARAAGAGSYNDDRTSGLARPWQAGDEVIATDRSSPASKASAQQPSEGSAVAPSEPAPAEVRTDGNGGAVTPGAGSAGIGTPGAGSVGTPAERSAAATERVDRALALARARLADAPAPSGEPVLGHAQGTIAILRELFADDPTQVAAALFGAFDAIPLREVETDFGAEVAQLVDAMRHVHRLRALHFKVSGQADGGQIETLRRMLLSMALDIRVVLMALASRLQTLRWHVATRRPPEAGIAQQTLKVMAPLANRLGLWQLKWELEDLAFRFESPDTYRRLAGELEEKRREREAFVAQATAQVRTMLADAGLHADVSGRPKHIYSIWNKMRVKDRGLEDIQDLRGLRVIVADVRECYAALALIHERWSAVAEEFDDYIAKPKPNGYQSLHTVVIADDGKPLEVQIRTREMHQFAEYGVASHWRYKERSTGDGAGASPSKEGSQDERIAWIRQLLAWQREVGAELGAGTPGTGTGAVRVRVRAPVRRAHRRPRPRASTSTC